MTAEADRVVVVGSGSAGRRHVTALRAALPDAELVVVRRRASEQPMDALRAAGATVVEGLAEALARVPRPDLAVVAGPATHHAVVAEALGRAGSAVLVEKPLTADVVTARELAGRFDALRRPLLVGYHLTRGDTVPELGRLLSSGAVGPPSSFDLSVGQQLAEWRPGAADRSVSARAELGGGVLLELSHELDGLVHLLGPVSDVRVKEMRHDGAPTDGVVDTSVDLELTLESGARGTVHLDMVTPTPTRIWRFRGPRGELVADLLAGRIELHGAGGPPPSVLREGTPGERDRAEHRLIAELVASAGERRGTGAEVARVVEAARRSHGCGGAPCPVDRPATAVTT